MMESGDQAAGLRHLLASRGPRVLSVVASGSSGKTSFAVNLAVALTGFGSRVLVLDGAAGSASAAWLLNIDPEYDVLDAIRGRIPSRYFPGTGSAQVRVVSWRRLLGVLDRLDEDEQERMQSVLDSICQDTDVVLIDTPSVHAACACSADECLVLTCDHPQAVEQTYGMLKRLQLGCRDPRVSLVVNKARSEPHAERIFGNLSKASRRFLNLPLELLGAIPEDSMMKHAERLRRPIVEVFPQAEAALALSRIARSVFSQPRAPAPRLHASGMAGLAQRLILSARANTAVA